MPRALVKRRVLGAAVMSVAVACAPVGVATAMVEDSTSATAGPAPDPGSTVGQLVLKVAAGAEIESVNRRLGSTTRSTLLASRGVYLLDVPLDEPTNDADKRKADWAKQVQHVITELTKDPAVVYAEANSEADITEGNRFHYWPSGGPVCLGSDDSTYTGQSAARRLGLAQIHRSARGARSTVAILDTGLDDRQPALIGHVAPGGYDYIEDDAQPEEVTRGQDRDGDGFTDEGYGHGTFVAGIVALVAPEAKILPQRVLDAEGRGNVFMVAEAIYDAVAAGADVINLSFGTADKIHSKVLDEAVRSAEKRGAVVVAAAGNDGSSSAHYPAAMSGVISVAAQAEDSSDLADFSTRGKWVDLAAPGERVVSTLPCGFGAWSGTSMAAPFVSGGAAVIIGLRPKIKPTDVVKAIGDGSDKVRGLRVQHGALNLRRSLARLP